MARFVLASSSVNRKEILERAGIEFTVIVSNADESNGPKAPDALVKELSAASWKRFCRSAKVTIL